MALIKKPSELTVTPTLSAMIYGQPGLGKTTLACSAPNPVLFDFDGGVTRIHGAHQVPTVQITKWEDVTEALQELKDMPDVQSIIIDTAGKMLMYMDDYIKRTNPKTRKADGSLSLQGYGVRKGMFIDFNKQVRMMGKHVIYVAHEIEQKRDDETTIRPEIGGSSTNDLMKELDLVGYMEAYGKQRTITFDPCQKYYAKNTCNMAGTISIPTIIDEQGNPTGENNFMQTVIANYHHRLQQNKEQTSLYEDICEMIHSNIADIANADDANRFCEWVKGLQHVYNSKAVAAQALTAKAKELGLQYDKMNKTYLNKDEHAA